MTHKVLQQKYEVGSQVNGPDNRTLPVFHAMGKKVARYSERYVVNSELSCLLGSNVDVVIMDITTEDCDGYFVTVRPTASTQ